MKSLFARVPLALCLLTAIAIVAGLVLSPAGTSLATHKNGNDTSEAEGWTANAEYWVGWWDMRTDFIEEDTILFIVNGDFVQKGGTDIGNDVIVFVFDAEGAGLGCQLQHLSAMDVARVPITLIPAKTDPANTVIGDLVDSGGVPPFGAVKVVAYKGGEGLQGDASSKKTGPTRARLGVWTQQTDTGSDAPVASTNVFPVQLTTKEREHIEDEFDFPSHCQVNPAERPDGKNAKVKKFQPKKKR